MKFPFSILLIIAFHSLYGQQSNPSDLVDEFYSWYTKGGYRDLKPTFRRLDNGMTDMDFSISDQYCSKFGFSNSLIEKSKKIYQHCRENLSSIPFDEFERYTDLDQFEAIGCSFQFWQWFGRGMEHYRYQEIIKTEKKEGSEYQVLVGLKWNENDSVLSHVLVTVKVVQTEWKIVDIKTDWSRKD